MAILFDDASSQYIEINSAPVVAAPFTMGCWFNTDSSALVQVLMSIQDKDVSVDSWSLQAAGFVSGDPVRVTATRGAATQDNVDTTSGYTASSWQHACGVFASATDRRVFLNGGSKGTTTVSRAPQGADRLSIGRWGLSSPSNYMSGSIAEAAIWSAALSDVEVSLLGLGFSPLLVRPESLVFYLPMIALGGAGSQADWMGGVSLTETNTPLTAAHPPNIIYPSWMTSGYGIPVVSSALAGTLRMTGGMTAIPLAANYKIFSSDVPRRTFVSR